MSMFRRALYLLSSRSHARQLIEARVPINEKIAADKACAIAVEKIREWLDQNIAVRVEADSKISGTYTSQQLEDGTSLKVNNKLVMLLRASCEDNAVRIHVNGRSQVFPSASILDPASDDTELRAYLDQYAIPFFVPLPDPIW
jgi:hypothetical protein